MSPANSADSPRAREAKRAAGGVKDIDYDDEGNVSVTYDVVGGSGMPSVPMPRTGPLEVGVLYAVGTPEQPEQPGEEVRDREACVYGCRMCINLHLMCISRP